MLSPIPYGGYEFLSEDEVQRFDIFDHEDDGPLGFLIVGDFSIEPAWHDFWDQLCPFPEKMTINCSDASSFQRNFVDDDGRSFISQFNQPQLNLNLYSKSNYPIHHFLLKLFLRIGGIKVDSITQIIRYRQSRWMAPFIREILEKRRESSDDALRCYLKVRNICCT